VRHYYSLTSQGEIFRLEKEAELKDFIATVSKIIKP